MNIFLSTKQGLATNFEGVTIMDILAYRGNRCFCGRKPFKLHLKIQYKEIHSVLPGMKSKSEIC